VRYDFIPKVYRYYMEDRLLKDLHYIDMNNSAILISRANKLGDQELLQFCKLIENWSLVLCQVMGIQFQKTMNMITKTKSSESLSQVEKDSFIFGGDFKILNNRVYFTKIDKETYNEISKLPYFMIEYELLNKNRTDGICKYIHNKA